MGSLAAAHGAAQLEFQILDAPGEALFMHTLHNDNRAHINAVFASQAENASIVAAPRKVGKRNKPVAGHRPTWQASSQQGNIARTFEVERESRKHQKSPLRGRETGYRAWRKDGLLARGPPKRQAIALPRAF